MILTVTPNPCVDKTLFVDSLQAGTKIRAGKYTCIPGGKGTNVSRAVKALGGETAAMVIVGGETGKHVVSMIEKQDKVRCVPLWVQAMTRTITTVLEEPLHRQTALFEPGPSVNAEEEEKILISFATALPEAKVVTLNGTVPDPELRLLYKEMLCIARDTNVISILDSYGPPFLEGLKLKPYMVKPNLEEAEATVGYPLDTLIAQQRALDFFHEKGIRLVALSLGPAGVLVSHDGEQLHVVPPLIKEVNAVGSGDALVAGFALGLKQGLSLEAMACLGVAAGAANAMSWDIGHFTAEEVASIQKRVKVVKL